MFDEVARNCPNARMDQPLAALPWLEDTFTRPRPDTVSGLGFRV